MSTSKSRRKYYQWEKIMKGSANHHRLEMLELISKQSDLSSEEIVTKLNINYQTGADHLRRLVKAGLVNTHRKGNRTNHQLSPYGKSIIKFLEKLK